jgi:hypothetical protein
MTYKITKDTPIDDRHMQSVFLLSYTPTESADKISPMVTDPTAMQLNKREYENNVCLRLNESHYIYLYAV